MSYEFVTNTPPYGGVCSASPPEGVALQTRFSLQCAGWQDEELPLKYEYYYRTEAGVKTLLHYAVSENPPEKLKLPVGRAEKEYALRIFVRVEDNLGTSNESAIDVKVCLQITCSLEYYISLSNCR